MLHTVYVSYTAKILKKLNTLQCVSYGVFDHSVYAQISVISMNAMNNCYHKSQGTGNSEVEQFPLKQCCENL